MKKPSLVGKAAILRETANNAQSSSVVVDGVLGVRFVTIYIIGTLLAWIPFIVLAALHKEFKSYAVLGLLIVIAVKCIGVFFTATWNNVDSASRTTVILSSSEIFLLGIITAFMTLPSWMSPWLPFCLSTFLVFAMAITSFSTISGRNRIKEMELSLRQLKNTVTNMESKFADLSKDIQGFVQHLSRIDFPKNKSSAKTLTLDAWRGREKDNEDRGRLFPRRPRRQHQSLCY